MKVYATELKDEGNYLVKYTRTVNYMYIYILIDAQPIRMSVHWKKETGSDVDWKLVFKHSEKSNSRICRQPAKSIRIFQRGRPNMLSDTQRRGLTRLATLNYDFQRKPIQQVARIAGLMHHSELYERLLKRLDTINVLHARNVFSIQQKSMLGFNGYWNISI